MKKSDYAILVLSCDKYEPCWTPFFTLLDKYFTNHPKVYLVTETKKCEYCETINVDSDIWSKRFLEALRKIKNEYVLVMLDDFFIRDYVDVDRINDIEFTDDIICYNFELEYREPALKLREWDVQKNNQVYLNSCQPTLWCKSKLMQRLYNSLNPQEWELLRIDSKYIHFINNKDLIIDIGYRHQDLSIGWGITRGKLSRECRDFLEKEGLLNEIVDYYTLL